MQIHATADTFDLPDPRVWVSGDWHGNTGWIQTVFPAMRRHDAQIKTVLQVGDYGFLHEDAGTHPIDYWAKKTGIERVLVTLGNHEDWHRIVTAQEDYAPGMAMQVSEVVWLLPRPFRFSIAGREVLSLGGASSVDKAHRTPGRDWFAEELITEDMERAAIAGGPADLLLTHESPAVAVPEVQRILQQNPHDYPIAALAISQAQRERVQRVQDSVKPALHVHGHLHVFGDMEYDEDRRVISLDRDTFARNVGVLEMTDLSFEPLPMASIRGRE